MARMHKQIIAAFILVSAPLFMRLVYAELLDIPQSTCCTETVSQTTTSTTSTESILKDVSARFNWLFNSTDQPAWQTRTDFFYDVQQKNTPVTGFESIQPLYECGLGTLFAQGRAGYTDGDTAFNLGLGHRYITPDKSLMFGINAFYDEIFRYPHKRVGLGGEVFTPFVTFRANYYDAYTGQHFSGENTYERAASGFDASVETPFPYVSWTRFTLKGYYWKGNRATSVKGGLVDLRVYPARQLEVTVGYANDNIRNSQLFLNLNYYFGSPDFVQYSASTPHPCPLFAAQDLEKVRLEKVLRSNQIVSEKTHFGHAILVARTEV